MNTVLFSLVLFLEILQWIIFIDVILSWLTLAGIKIRPKFIYNLIDPIYEKIREIIPTRIGVMDFTPIVAIIFLIFLRGIIFLIFPEIQTYSLNLLK